MSKLTVLIPALNEQHSIARCLTSIAGQLQDMEIVVLDDCSEDGTVAAACQALPGDPRLRVMGAQFRLGAHLNLLRGALCCTSPYVLFFSANDVLMPGVLPRLLQYMETTPDCVACYGSSATMDRGRISPVPAAHYVDVRQPAWIDRCIAVVARYSWGAVQYAVYRTPVLQQAYPHEARYGADHLFFFLLASLGEIHWLSDVDMRREDARDTPTHAVRPHVDWYRRAAGQHLASAPTLEQEIRYPFLSMAHAHFQALRKLLGERQVQQDEASAALIRLMSQFLGRFGSFIQREMAGLEEIAANNPLLFTKGLGERPTLEISAVHQYLVLRGLLDFGRRLGRIRLESVA